MNCQLLNNTVIPWLFGKDIIRLAVSSKSLWDVARPQAERAHNLAHQDANMNLYDIEFSPNGKMFAYIDPKNKVVIWDAESGEILGTIENAISFSFSPNSRYLSTISQKSNISNIMWDCLTKTCALSGYADLEVFSLDSRYIAKSFQNIISVYDFHTSCIEEIPYDLDFQNGEYVYDLRFLENKRLLIAIALFLYPSQLNQLGRYHHQRIIILDTNTKQVVSSFSEFNFDVLYLSSNGSSIAFSHDFGIKVLSTQDNFKEILSIGHNREEIANSLCFCISPNNHYFSYGNMIVYDLTNQSMIHLTSPPKLEDLANGKTEFIVEPQQWSLATNDFDLKITAFSHDGQYFAAITESGLLCIWNLPSGALCHLFYDDEGFLFFSFSPDNRFLVTGSRSQGISMICLETAQYKLKPKKIQTIHLKSKADQLIYTRPQVEGPTRYYSSVFQ